MATKSTARTSSRKSSRSTKPEKPRPDFPLSQHKGTGYWCKKLRGKVYYFGKVAEDPKGVAALEQFNREWPYYLEGKEPPAVNVEAVTVKYLCDAFCTHQEERAINGASAPRTWQGLKATCKTIVDVFGKTRHVEELTPDDFGKLRKRLATKRRSVSLRNEMMRVRAVFRFAKTDGLIERDIRYGSKFEAPKPKQLRKERRGQRDQHGKRMPGPSSRPATS